MQKQILSELHQISQKRNVGILLITHDLGVVAEIADTVFVNAAWPDSGIGNGV